MMLAGTMIPCGQRTLIVSTNPGQVSCVVSKDVYSANGAALLLERGSEVTGERLQPLQLGQEMLSVTWSRVVTPRGVIIDIDSLATDTLGASGLPVYVDEHWRKRFGSAIMLSLISDLGQAAANKAADAEGTIRLTTTANAGQDLASRALDKTINIPPTGYSLQGEAINIFVARDVDFGRVYELARY
jgi:type IV secretion system protein VirB10